jgi:hypothetical protein
LTIGIGCQGCQVDKVRSARGEHNWTPSTGQRRTVLNRSVDNFDLHVARLFIAQRIRCCVAKRHDSGRCRIRGKSHTGTSNRRRRSALRSAYSQHSQRRTGGVHGVIRKYVDVDRRASADTSSVITNGQFEQFVYRQGHGARCGVSLRISNGVSHYVWLRAGHHFDGAPVARDRCLTAFNGNHLQL